MDGSYLGPTEASPLAVGRAGAHLGLTSTWLAGHPGWTKWGGKRERQALGANELAIVSLGRRPCHQARVG